MNCAQTWTLLVAITGLCGCAQIGRIPLNGKHDTLVVQLRSTDSSVILSGTRCEVMGWIEHNWGMRSRVTLAECFSDETGRFSTRVPQCVGYVFNLSGRDKDGKSWTWYSDIERKALPADIPIIVEVRSFLLSPHPVAKAPNK